LNKSDIFKKKIKKYPLSKSFDDVNQEEVKKFKGALKYMSSKFEVIYGDRGPGKLYVFHTNALDTENCKKVFDSVRDQVVSSSLKTAGFF